MRTTIDKAGRVVIPQSIRERLNLAPGQEIEVRERDGLVEIEPTSLEVVIEEGDHGPIAVPRGSPPPLSDDLVRATIEQTRR